MAGGVRVRLDDPQDDTPYWLVSTRRPVRIAFAVSPAAEALREAIDAAIPDALWYDDVHGAPDWRRHVTHRLAEEIRQELAGGA